MSLSNGRLGTVAAAALLATLIGTAHAAPARYAITVLDPPPRYVELHPSSINTAGEIVGTAVDSISGASTGLIWRNGLASEVGTLSGIDSRGLALNDAGVVVGEAVIGAELHAFEWNGEAMRDLGIPGHESGATAINSTGLIVGYERDALGNAHAMIWDRGVGHRLDRFETGFSYAVAINGSGQAIITAYLSGPGGSPGTYLWDNGSLTFVGAFAATAMNTSAQVVGYTATPLPDVQGLLWERDSFSEIGGRTTPLVPVAINDHGQIVGSTLSSAGEEHAAIWEDGLVLDLNDALGIDEDWELWRATDINNVGQIVGYGTLHGQQRAFMLTPAGSNYHVASTSR